MAFALSRLERIYLQVQSAFNTVPNTTGTATVGNANACRFIKAVLDNMVGTIDRADKTGTLSDTPGSAGRASGKWSVEMSLAPNGTVAVVPDCDPILQAIFGQTSTVTAAGTATITGATAATPIVVTATAHGLVDRQAIFISGCNNLAANGAWIVNLLTANTVELIGSVGVGQTAGTTGSIQKGSVKYALADAVIPFSFWDFRQPSTIEQRVGIGCVPSRATFNFGQDGAATWSSEGESKFVASSHQLANLDTDRKGGLTAFPTEPAAPVTNGGMVVGFTGKAVVKGNLLAGLRTASVEIGANATTVKDSFGAYTAQEAERDGRKVNIRFSIYEDDTQAWKDMVQAAQEKTTMETIFVAGTVAGSIMIVHCKGVQLDPPAREEERRFIGNFSGKASASSLANRDEITVWFV